MLSAVFELVLWPLTGPIVRINEPFALVLSVQKPIDVDVELEPSLVESTEQLPEEAAVAIWIDSPEKVDTSAEVPAAMVVDVLPTV